MTASVCSCSQVFRIALMVGFATVAMLASGPLHAEDVLTQRNDNSRTGASTWPGLNQSSVQGFRLLATLHLNGPVTAQPLFAEGVEISGVKRSVLFTATALNTIVAFDANAPFQVLWTRQLDPAWSPNDAERIELGGAPNGQGGLGGGYSQMVQIGVFPHDHPVLGIESTPVIDRNLNRMFVSYRTAGPRQRLASIDISNGEIRTDVEMPGNAMWHKLHRNRASLLLDRGIVFVAFAGMNEGNTGNYNLAYQGWIHAFDAATLALLGSYRTVTDPANHAADGDPTFDRFDGGGIWQGSTGLAADSAGRIYFATGNAKHMAFSTNAIAGGINLAGPAAIFPSDEIKQKAKQFVDSALDLSSSIVRLKVTPVAAPGKPPSITMTPEDWFTPYRRYWQDRFDMDLGAGGVMLVPGTNFLLAGGKEGMLYLLDRNQMGRFDIQDPVVGFCPSFDDEPNRDKVVQKFRAASNVYFEADARGRGQIRMMCDTGPTTARNTFNFLHWPHIHGTPVFGKFPSGKAFVYLWPEKDALKSYAWLGNRLDEKPKHATNAAGAEVLTPPFVSFPRNGMPGGMLSLSIDPTLPDAGVLFASVQRCGIDNKDTGTFEPVECSTGNCPLFLNGPDPLNPQVGLPFHSNDFTTQWPCSSQMHGMLRAFDPLTMVEVWNDQSDIVTNVGMSSHGMAGEYMYAKFLPPTIAKGRVFLGTDIHDNNEATVRVYGNLNLNGIWRFAGPTWEHLDDSNRTVTVAAAGDKLYQLQNDGSIWRYTEKPCRAIPFTVAWNDPHPDLAPPCPGWEVLDRNPKTVAITAGGSKLYQLHNDGSIHQSTGDVCGTDGVCRGWFPLDTNHATVAIAANDVALFQLHNDGSIHQSSGEACAADGSCRGWFPLDNNGRTVAIAASGNELYQLHHDGAIYQSTGDACRSDGSCPGWRPLDNNRKTVAIAAGRGALYQLHNDGAISQSTGAACATDQSCPGWTPLDNNTATVAIAAGGTNLYQLHNDGSVWRRDGAIWTKLDGNSRTSSISAADKELYQLHEQPIYQLHQNGELWRYTSPGWELLDHNPATTSISANGKELYQLHNDGSIWRFTGLACNGAECAGWELLDRNPAAVAIAAAGREFFQLHRTGEVWRYAGAEPCTRDPCPGWERIDDHKGTAIAAAGRHLFQMRSGGSIWRYLGGQACGKSPCAGWELLDRNSASASIVAAGKELYQMHKNGEIWRLTGLACDPASCPGWEQLDRNGATTEIAASGTQLIQLHKDGKIWRHTGRPCDTVACPGWELLDANPASAAITVGGKEVYQMHAGGTIWRYTGIPCDAAAKCVGWEQLDGNAGTRAIVAEGTSSIEQPDTKPPGHAKTAGPGNRRKTQELNARDIEILSGQARRLLREYLPELEGR